MEPAIEIRAAASSDATALSPLVTELGYPATPAEVSTRLHELEAAGNAICLVAVLEGEVLGLVTAHLIRSIHSTAPVGWLTTLVVGSRARHQGVGTGLIGAAETWVALRGAERISVTSALRRSDSHAFYAARGYERSGLRFTKSLGGTP